MKILLCNQESYMYRNLLLTPHMLGVLCANQVRRLPYRAN